jgi:hypothetical protein
MRKYNKPLSKIDEELLDKLSKKDFTNFKEADVREEFLTPLLTLLGYEKNTDYEVEREEGFSFKGALIPFSEMYLRIGKSKKKLDYICNVRKNNFWIMEAKSGSKKEIDEKDIEQAYSYSLHPKVNCRYFLVSNGWQTNLYDRNKFLLEEEANIFEPILSIPHHEIAKKFHELNYKIGAPNVVFNVKEDCLLREIKKTMSAEVYVNRLEQFEWKVQKALRESESKVYENIRSLNKRENTKQKQDDEFRSYLESLRDIDIIKTFFNRSLTNGNFDIIYSVFKKKILGLFAAVGNSRSSSLSHTFSYLLSPSPTNFPTQRIIKFSYPINVVVLLLKMVRDDEFKDLRVWYCDTECTLRDVIEKYLLDIFSFFEKDHFLRYSTIIYPLCYKLSKFYIFGYGLADSHVKRIIGYREYFLSEEDLSQTYHSIGSESVNSAEESTDKLLQDLIKNGFGRDDKVKPELFKKTVRELENTISLLGQKIDLNKLKREIPTSHQDEMFPIDNHADNPWQILFMYVIRILNEYKYLIQNNETKNKIEELAKNGFISKPLFIQAFYDYPDFERSFHDKKEEAVKIYNQYPYHFDQSNKEDAAKKMAVILERLKSQI